MLRLFYKTILVTVISLMLSFGEIFLFADTKGNLTKNKDGTVERTNTYSFKGAEASDDSAMNILTMLAVGFVGTKLISYKKWTPDMMVAAGASAIYLGGEVINLMSYKKKVEDIEAKVKFTDGTVDSAQVEYIKQLKQSYEDIKSSLETKKALQSAAFVGFLAAAGIATYQYFNQESLYANCQMAVTNSFPTLATCAAVTTLPNESGSCMACKAALSTYEVSLNTIKTTKEATAPSSVKSAEFIEATSTASKSLVTGCNKGSISIGVSASVQAACGAYFANEKIDQAAGTALSCSPTAAWNENILKLPIYISSHQTIDSNQLIKNKIKSLINYLIPKAEAGWMSMLGLSGGIAAAFLTKSCSLGVTVDQAIFSPGGRIAIWGGFALLTKLAMNGTESKISEMESNISKIDKIISEMDKLKAGVKASNSVVTSAKINTSGLGNKNYAFSNNDKTGCATSSCKSMASQISDAVNGINGLPSAFATAAKGVGSIADGVSNTGTLSAGTISSAGNLGGSANAISKKLKGLQSAVNKKLSAAGKAERNFDDLDNKFKNNLLKSTENALRGSGYTAQGMLASLGLNPGNTTAVEEPKNAAKKVTDANSAFPVMPTKKENFDLEDKKDDGQVVSGLTKDNAKYDMNGTDISKDKGSNIFDIISSRYLKSAFPRLLEEEK